MSTHFQTKHEINKIWWILRLLYGITFIVAGADKFFGYITHWDQLISPHFAEYVGLMPTTLVHLSGIAEIILGLLVFTPWVKQAAILITLWMLSNGLYLAYFGMYFDTAARYCALGICAWVFYLVTNVRENL